MFADYDAKAPFERAPSYGFRLAKYSRPLPQALAAPVRIAKLGRDARKEKPVGDDIFAVYRRQYAYDRSPLNASVEATEERTFWTKHTVAFDTAYGGERMRAYLFLPNNASPPYQTVIFFPAARRIPLCDRAGTLAGVGGLHHPEWTGVSLSGIQRDVRAVGRPTRGSNAERELRIAWARDFGRAIDYLETRSDIDRARLAFYGVSAGGDAGVILTALEPRLKTSVLQGTGLWREYGRPKSICSTTRHAYACRRWC